MTIDQWLQTAQPALEVSGIDSARLDSLLLLEDATSHDRGWLLAHSEAELNAEQLDALADDLVRRLQHEPLAYIRGHAAFYGREFMVDERVLVPRPESEAIIELLKTLQPTGLVADIGTGSGCLAVTAALETGAVVCAVDIDVACLAVAGTNAVHYTASIELLYGNLLEPFTDRPMPQVLLCNLPYVPDDYEINEAAAHEPALALFAGFDGLDYYRQLFMQLSGRTDQPRHILTESLKQQHTALAKQAGQYGYQLQQTDGLVQLFNQA